MLLNIHFLSILWVVYLALTKYNSWILVFSVGSGVGC